MQISLNALDLAMSVLYEAALICEKKGFKDAFDEWKREATCQ